MGGFLTRRWELILPGCSGTSALAREATIAACCLHEPQPISNQPVGLGFQHHAGRYRPGGSAFSSPASWSCRDMDGFLTGDGELSSPGAAGPQRWPEGQLSPRAGSMSPSQSAIPLWGWGFHTLRAVSTRGICVFVPSIWSCRCMAGFLMRGWQLILPGVRWIFARSPANQGSASGTGVSTPYAAVLTRGITAFIPRFLEL